MSDLKEVAVDVAEGDAYDGAVVVATGPDATDIAGEITTDDQPVEASLMMLAAHINHITATARASGGDVTQVEVCRDALQLLQQSMEEVDE